MESKSLDHESIAILEFLTFRGRMDFQQIVTRTSGRRNTIREKLNRLIRSGLVREENRGKWKRGMRLIFEVTKKGERHLFESYTDNLNETFGKIGQILRKIKENSSVIGHFKQAAHESIVKSIYSDRPFDLPIEPPKRDACGKWQKYIARWDRHRTTQQRIFGQLENSFRTISGLIVEIQTSDDSDSELRTRALRALETEPVIHVILPLEKVRIELNLIDKSARSMA
jgi:predicted transcriptional regulator